MQTEWSPLPGGRSKPRPPPHSGIFDGRGFFTDASVAIRWFIEEEAHPHADEVLEKVIDKPERFAVPELFAFGLFPFYNAYIRVDLRLLERESFRCFKEGYSGIL